MIVEFCLNNVYLTYTPFFEENNLRYFSLLNNGLVSLALV